MKKIIDEHENDRNRVARIKGLSRNMKVAGRTQMRYC